MNNMEIEAWEYLDIESIWEVILTAHALEPENQLEIYRKWIPRLRQRLEKEKDRG